MTQSMNVAADKQYDPENRGHPSCHVAPVSAGWRLRLIRPTVRAACLLFGLNPPGGAAAYRGYSAARFGSPEKA
ncbi:hypothetical protein NUBL12144_10780 [Klebsiella pneumoniae]|nr:hypothetical protein NUBL12144_10780 [Klebsiella pneumoniae]